MKRVPQAMDIQGPDTAAPLRWLRISLSLALLLLIAGFAAMAASEPPAGYALFAGAGAGCCAGFALMAILRTRIRSHTLRLQARQRADLDRVFRDR
jgi:hypothetical protein